MKKALRKSLERYLSLHFLGTVSFHRPNTCMFCVHITRMLKEFTLELKELTGIRLDSLLCDLTWI